MSDSAPHEDWPQFLVEFTDSATARAEGPGAMWALFVAARTAERPCRWWFVRKGATWRARYQPTSQATTIHLEHELTNLKANGRITNWAHGIYEPETTAFGGPGVMGIAHTLFHRHAHETVSYQLQPAIATRPLGERELAIALPSVLMRAAALDRFEQGDVWARVAHERSTAKVPEVAAGIQARAQRIMNADVGPSSLLLNGPLSPLTEWITTFATAGEQLADLARRGRLQRGLRAVVAHHVIFTWNILGVPIDQQAALANLAKGTIMGTATDAASSASLRHSLADALKAQGAVVSDTVDAAVRTVPRHIFVHQSKPGATLDEAYSDETVHIKFDDSGTSISAVSQPTINAHMLELTDARQGMRIKEAGAGSGLFAAYLGHIVGPTGHVWTYDVDDDLVANAQAALGTAGAANVTVVLGDGSTFHTGGAPYDRIVATVGAHAIPPAWLDQLAPSGRLVVPLRVRGSVSRAIAFEQQAGRWRSTTSELSVFMPLRGAAQDPRRHLSLADGAVTLQTDSDQTIDQQALTGVLSAPRTESRTNVTFRGNEPRDLLELYLSCALDNGLSRMTATDHARSSGLVMPKIGAATMAAIDKTDLAYLAWHQAGTDNSGNNLYGITIAGHGPTAHALVDRITEAAETWDRHYRHRDVGFEIHPLDNPPPATGPGRFVITTPLNRLLVTWEPAPTDA